MSTFINDIRHAIRKLARTPGFTAVAVLVLALGIGANTAVFSVFDRVILQLLPVENPRELVLIEVDGPRAPGRASSDNQRTVHSYPQYRDFREQAEVFSGVIARTSAPIVLAHDSQANRISGELVSGNFFDVLGIRPAKGRLFTDQDDLKEGGHSVAVISDAFWRERFGGRADIVGQEITLNGLPMEIVGVTPPGFHGVMSGRMPDVYVTLAMRKQIRPLLYAANSYPERLVRSFNVLARLKPDVTFQQASTAMQGFWRRMQQQELELLGGRIQDREEFLARSLRLIPAWQGIHSLRSKIEEPLLSVTALAALVLLIACVNMAGLLMTRAIARRREIAVRIALGAPQLHLVRQTLLESLVLGLLGGLAGLFVAFGTTKVLTVLTEVGELNSRTLVFNFILASLAALLFGLVPAWQAIRTPVSAAIKDQTAGAGAARGHARFRQGAVVTQIALSTLLLVAAGLFTKTLYNLRHFDPGFRTENLLGFTLDPTLNGYDSEQSRLLYDRVLGQLQRLPGVQSVGAAALPALGHSTMTSSLKVERYQPSEGEHVTVSRNIVSAGYFETMGIPLVMGREFNEHDRTGTARVAVVNQAFVERYCSGENPIGRGLSFADGTGPFDVEIVGVVKNQKNADLREPIERLAYTPYTQEASLSSLTFYLWCQQDEAAVGPDVRRIVRQLDANLPISRMQTIESRRDEVLRPERTVALLACTFAAIAAVLAAVGLYGLLAHAVVRRTREIGIRMALGAQRAAVFRLVFREALLCFVAGLAIGVPLALGLGRYLESQLFGLEASDPTVTLAAAVILGIAVFIAALLPSRRAAKIDPMEALRYE